MSLKRTLNLGSIPGLDGATAQLSVPAPLQIVYKLFDTMLKSLFFDILIHYGRKKCSILIHGPLNLKHWQFGEDRSDVLQLEQLCGIYAVSLICDANLWSRVQEVFYG